MKLRDINCLKHMMKYCDDIKETLSRFGRDPQIFAEDKDYRNSICMSILQIGELAGNLTEEFREATKDEMFWPAIIGMRNIFAHDYGNIDVDKVWETAQYDVVSLHMFCESVIERVEKGEITYE